MLWLNLLDFATNIEFNEQFIRKYYDLSRRIVIPNLLNEEYKVVI